MRSQTNYLLTDEQSNELKKLWGGELEYPDEADEAVAYPEGHKVYKIHRTIERNMKLTRLVKNKELIEKGELRCSVCGFSFLEHTEILVLIT